jgi:hypothetical protein
MSLELTGKVKVINDTQTFDSGFTKREFVITTGNEYPQDIKFEIIKDKVQLLNSVNVGDNVQVSFNLKGNEYNGKYYVNLQAWRLNKVSDEPVNISEPVAAGLVTPEDDLPF